MKVAKLNVEAGKFKLETSMRSYVSPELISELGRNPEKLKIAGEEKEVTILHMEVRGFTTLHEKCEPEQVTEYISKYNTQMTNHIFEFGGTVDRLLGDTLTAFWGAPIEYKDAAERACTAALKMHETVKKISPELEQLQLPPLLPVFAITTTNVIVGNMGSEQRFNYSIMGDYSYILQGLAQLNYNFNTNILMTEYTRSRISKQFKTRILAEQLITKGKNEPIDVYELISTAS